MKKIITYAHELIQEVTQADDIVIDATCGNGYDTLFLSELVPSGKVYAFDVQSKAIETTQMRLVEKNISHVKMIYDSHANIKHHLLENEKIKSAIFNLGYLPHGDKNIITQADSTLKAIQQIMAVLEVRGRIVLVIYSGHAGGESEKHAVTHFAENLPQENFEVLKYQFINQKNNPPFIIAIEKRKETDTNASPLSR